MRKGDPQFMEGEAKKGKKVNASMADSDNGNVLVVFTSEDLKVFTNNFNGGDLIGITKSGRFYKGQLRSPWSTAIQPTNVTVQILDKNNNQEEVKLTTNPSLNCHPNLAKLIGYCFEDEIKGVVYDLNPLGLLQNLMAKDDFNWVQRVHVILELVQLMDFIHSQEKQSLAFKFRASNLLLDWDCKPKLCGFGFISNGTNADRDKLYEFARIPSAHFHPSIRGGSQGEMISDVNFLGEILLGLIAKRDFEPEKQERQNHHWVANSLVSIWAKNEYRPNASLVHETLQKDWGYSPEEGVELTELAMHSIEFFQRNRPSIKQILQRLEGLQVTRRLSDPRPRKKERKFPSSDMNI